MIEMFPTPRQPLISTIRGKNYKRKRSKRVSSRTLVPKNALVLTSQ